MKINLKRWNSMLTWFLICWISQINASITKCMTDITKADFNRDSKFNKREWLTFLKLQNLGYENYEELPLSLKTLFFSMACAPCTHDISVLCCSDDEMELNEMDRMCIALSNIRNHRHRYLQYTENNLISCKSDLSSADENNDGYVDASEWIYFVSSQSNGAITSELYQNLPLPYILLFTSSSCLCRGNNNTDVFCCLGDNGRIDLDNIESNENDSYFFDICSNSDLILQFLLPILPSMPPSISPTKLSSNMPSRIISSSPSYIPSIGTFIFPLIFLSITRNFLHLDLVSKENTFLVYSTIYK